MIQIGYKMIQIGYNNSTKHSGFITHYEKPDRVNFCIDRLKKEFDEKYFIQSKSYDITQLLNLVKLVHKEEYIEKMKNFKSKSFVCRNCNTKNMFREEKTFEEALEKKNNCFICDAVFDFDNLFCYASIDTYITYYTFEIALEAIGVVKDLLDLITSNNIKYTFALIRPPGHHCNNDPNGFCVFNNVMIGVKYAQEIGFSKVLILDVDFHHGDGTQQLIEANPDKNISFVSIHGYGEAIYPRTGGESNLEQNILNIPLAMTPHLESRLYITDDYYQEILDTQVFPFINNINPDLVIVSLGFDAHKDDPLEGMAISDLTYIYLTLKLKQLNKPVMFVLEGGYNVKTIGRLIPKMIEILG
jgi:acetoin utilization deacetylase AcuC-like enzyme